MSHFQEPWVEAAFACGCGAMHSPIVKDATGRNINLLEHHERIIACVNACRGILTDDLRRVCFYQPAEGNWPIRFVDADNITHVPCEITVRHNPVLRDEQSELCSPAESS